MGVYVDDRMARQTRKRPGGRLIDARWSQLFADTTAELLGFAVALGLARHWIQLAGTPGEHFDVTAHQRQRALAAGAEPITAAAADQLVAAKRAGAPSLWPDQATRDLDSPQNDNSAAPSSRWRRIQLSAAPGYTLPPATISVSPPSRWANPYRPARRTPGAYQSAVDRFTEYLARNPALLDQARADLAGHHLACWCPLQLPCHADIWLTLLNTDNP